MPNKMISAQAEDLRRDLVPVVNGFDSALPGNITARQFARCVVTAAMRSPSLFGCDRASLYLACQRAAEDGLMPDGVEAAIIPYQKKATYVPMVGGLLKRIHNAGIIEWITAQKIMDKDTFRFDPATGKPPEHIVDWFGDRGNLRGVYAVAKKYRSKSVFCVVLNRKEIDAAKDFSMKNKRDKNNPDLPWNSRYEEMACKTAIRRLYKLLPSSASVTNIFVNEDAPYNSEKVVEGVPVDTPPTKPRKSLAAEIVEAEAGPTPEEESTPYQVGPDDPVNDEEFWNNIEPEVNTNADTP